MFCLGPMQSAFMLGKKDIARAFTIVMTASDTDTVTTHLLYPLICLLELSSEFKWLRCVLGAPVHSRKPRKNRLCQMIMIVIRGPYNFNLSQSSREFSR